MPRHDSERSGIEPAFLELTDQFCTTQLGIVPDVRVYIHVGRFRKHVVREWKNIFSFFSF